MARAIHSRLKIKGMLVTETPLHVGGYGNSPDTDLPLAQNGKGEWYVPGTSIAGVLRNWCEKNFTEQNGKPKRIIKDLFGPKREKGIEEGHASFVLIEDATIENAPGVLAETRDGIGIDRFYGAAANGAKYDRAILPRGTRLNFVMIVEIGESHDANQIKAIIGHLLEALQKAYVRFGAAKTRGLGRMRLEKGKLKEEALHDFSGILRLLHELSKPTEQQTFTELKIWFETEEVKRVLKETPVNSAPLLEITIRWQPRLPLIVKAGYDGIGVDILPLTSGVDKDKLALVLPGSSIKGVLRSHAERIMRTLLNIPAPKDPQDKRNFNEQVAVPLVNELFGVRSKSDEEKQNTNLKKGLGLGALSIDDCYAKENYFMDMGKWRDVELARVDNEKSHTAWELWQKLCQIQSVKFQPTHHVAIDRWTGGASDGALYSVLVPTKVDWDSMSLTLEFGRIEKVSQLPVLMLLLLTLRDVAENCLPFGFATNRGMGEIVVQEISFSGSCLNKIGFTKEEGNFAELKEEVKNKFSSEAWKECLKKMQA